MTPGEIARFWPKVIRHSTGCWGWSGCIQRNGYTRFRAGGRTTLGHRFSYELHKGPIPPKMQIDHLCRNPSCVNPDHLEAVTNRENTMRGLAPIKARLTIANAQLHRVAKQRAKTHCAQGHVYDAANTRRDRFGNRRCAQCGRDHSNAYGYRKRAEAILLGRE